MAQETTLNAPDRGKILEAHGKEQILFFDGVCVLCNKSVGRAIKLDPRAILKYAALQGPTAEILLETMTEEEKLAGVIIYDRGQIFQGPAAILRTGAILFPWTRPLTWFANLPPFIWFWKLLYNIIARKRYNWFGQMDSCAIPAPEVRHRYILN